MWLGSADDVRLRLYIPDESDGTLQQSTSLAEECFTFKTPVMAKHDIGSLTVIGAWINIFMGIRLLQSW
jgi:hypothetical protein